ncbi:MAG: ester cyclase [Actinomycetota bacterium]|nr:ester cyclase [Actinomycetota bacterium]
MPEDGKALVRRFWDEFVNQKDLDAPQKYYARNFVWHEPDQDMRDFAEVKRFAYMYFEAFPYVAITIEDLMLAEDDKVVSRYTCRGTHRGETGEFSLSTGRRFELEEITIHRFEGEKMVEHWECYDNLSFVQQLDLTIDPNRPVRGLTAN